MFRKVSELCRIPKPSETLSFSLPVLLFRILWLPLILKSPVISYRLRQSCDSFGLISVTAVTFPVKTVTAVEASRLPNRSAIIRCTKVFCTKYVLHGFHVLREAEMSDFPVLACTKYMIQPEHILRASAYSIVHKTYLYVMTLSV